jgi:RND superfamily putative drug exporter
MISVFLGFVASDDPVVKMMGVGLATAVAVDATIVRMVLVPSTMALVGDAELVAPTLAGPDPAAPRHRDPTTSTVDPTASPSLITASKERPE